MLVFVSVGSFYLLISVGVSIYRQRQGALKGAPVGVEISETELRGCWQELSDVTEGLQKHLEKFHFLLGGYDPDEAQRWGNEGAFWRKQWVALGKRCRFGEAIAGVRTQQRKDHEEMDGVYRELSETERDYTRELLRFGREQAPRLDRVRERVQQIGERLSRHRSQTEENKP